MVTVSAIATKHNNPIASTYNNPLISKRLKTMLKDAIRDHNILRRGEKFEEAALALHRAFRRSNVSQEDKTVISELSVRLINRAARCYSQSEKPEKALQIYERFITSAQAVGDNDLVKKLEIDKRQWEAIVRGRYQPH